MVISSHDIVALECAYSTNPISRTFTLSACHVSGNSGITTIGTKRWWHLFITSPCDIANNISDVISKVSANITTYGIFPRQYLKEVSMVQHVSNPMCGAVVMGPAHATNVQLVCMTLISPSQPLRNTTPSFYHVFSISQ